MNSWKRGWQGILLGALLLGGSWVEAAPIEMQVVEGDVRSVLLSLARTAHENIVLDDSVAGTVTLHATEEPAKLLRMIAASKGQGGLDVSRDDDAAGGCLAERACLSRAPRGSRRSCASG